MKERVKDFITRILPVMIFIAVPTCFWIYIIGSAVIDVHNEYEASRKRSERIEYESTLRRLKESWSTKSNKSSKKSNSSKKSYSYIDRSGTSYSDYEDFYYDNEEDFDSLDDAEDYYDEHYSDY